MKSKIDRIILGIDPGTTVMGYGLIHVKGNKMEIITMGVLHLSKLNSHADKLKRIFERTLGLIDEYKADEMALEAPFFGKNVQSMLKLGRAQGVAMAAVDLIPQGSLANLLNNPISAIYTPFSFILIFSINTTTHTSK